MPAALDAAIPSVLAVVAAAPLVARAETAVEILRVEAGIQDVVRIGHRRVAAVLTGEHVDAAILGVEQVGNLLQRVLRVGRDGGDLVRGNAVETFHLRIEAGGDAADLAERGLFHLHGAGRAVDVVLPRGQIVAPPAAATARPPPPRRGRRSWWRSGRWRTGR